jgi:hypothetical protein
VPGLGSNAVQPGAQGRRAALRNAEPAEERPHLIAIARGMICAETAPSSGRLQILHQVIDDAHLGILANARVAITVAFTWEEQKVEWLLLLGQRVDEAR